jgi:hypothetical protein
VSRRERLLATDAPAPYARVEAAVPAISSMRPKCSLLNIRYQHPSAAGWTSGDTPDLARNLTQPSLQPSLRPSRRSARLNPQNLARWPEKHQQNASGVTRDGGVVYHRAVRPTLDGKIDDDRAV